MSIEIKTLQYVNLVDLPGGVEAHWALSECSNFTFGDTAFTLVTRDEVVGEVGALGERGIAPAGIIEALQELPENCYVNLEG